MVPDQKRSEPARGAVGGAPRALWAALLTLVVLGLLSGMALMLRSTAVERAERALAAGNVTAAESVLRGHLRRSPDDSAARYRLGVLLRSQDAEAALRHFRQIPEDAAEYLDGLRHIAQIFLLTERVEEAERALHVLERADPNDHAVLLSLAELNFYADKYERALSYARRCIALEPTRVQTYLLIAEINDEMKQPVEMIPPLRRAIELDPECYQAHLNLAYAYDHAGKRDQAREEARWCLARNEKERFAHAVLADMAREERLKDLAHQEAGQGKRTSIRLRDVAQTAGIRFCHHSPLSPQRHLHLFFGSGVAWLDFDQNGRPDLFFCQGRAWFQDSVQGSPDDGHSNCLYRNLGDGTFADVTLNAGLADADYSMGTAVGDYNNDGFADLYVNNFGNNDCYRNNGDGTFTELAAGLGIDDGRYGSSCTWADIDRDGDLDLFVVNYLKIDLKNYPLCHRMKDGQEISSVCHPRYLPGEHDVLYRNEGDGTFTDITEIAGLMSEPPRQGLGITTADLDADGDLDFYVANDSVPNQLWINQGNGRFCDEGMLSGTSVNRDGQREAGMGVAIGDIEGDGRFDLFVTNYFNESNTLYRNQGELFFLDVTDELGVRAPSWTRLGLGVSLFDADGDGWLDLFVANGHVEDGLEESGRDEPFAQLPQLFQNDSGKRFWDISDAVGDYFRRQVVGRAVATADFDGDGRLDLAVLHLNGPAALLRNETQSAANVLQVELIGRQSDRDAIGAVLEVVVGNRKLLRLRKGSSGYLSCDEARLVIGIGQSPTVDRLLVHWPSGHRERWCSLPVNEPLRLVEGSGESEREKE